VFGRTPAALSHHGAIGRRGRVLRGFSACLAGFAPARKRAAPTPAYARAHSLRSFSARFGRKLLAYLNGDFQQMLVKAPFLADFALKRVFRLCKYYAKNA
jgi:hypothetical protein